MNTSVIALGGIILLYLGYRFYGSFIEKSIVRPDSGKKTPAHTLYDGKDFSPARKIILFGHHFSSISGAGPIIGPLLGVAYFGWGVSLVWILLGSVFLGGIHDYVSLMASVRNEGSSIAEIAERVMSKRAKAIFSAFLWMALVLVITVFGVVASQSLLSKPEIVLPTFMIIPLAMFFGWMVYRRRTPIFLASLIALGLLFLLIFWGYHCPLSLPQGIEKPEMVWFMILMAYCLVASVLPVWLLLQPRDYLSSFVLFLGLGLGYLGVILVPRIINAPAFVGFHSSEQGPLWPMLCVIIACGAISGFHSLVAGGTTSKQLNSEGEGKVIGFGGMLVEGALAILVLLVVSAGLFWRVPAGMEQFDFWKLMKTEGPIITFGTGYGRIVGALPGIGLTWATLFAIIMLKTFVLTTLDTAARLGRFIITESLGRGIRVFRNRWVATGVTIVPALYLGYTGSWKVIWPVFGAANQLIAALALMVVSSYLLGVKRPTRYTVIPGIFMLSTSVAALLYKGYNFFFPGQEEDPQYLLGIVSLVLVILAVFVIEEIRRAFRGKKIAGQTNKRLDIDTAASTR